MATGIVWYWNGESGWIKQTGVADLPTVSARDVMILPADVSSGTVARDSVVTFTVDPTNDPWLARTVTVS